MTFWAKLLIVVVFVLSLIFASMSVVLFGKREDFRSQLKAKSDQYDAEKADWTKKNADLTAKLSQAALETNQAKTVAEETQQRLDSATHEAERKDAEHRALTLSYQDERNLNLKLAADYDKLSDQVKSLLADTNSLKTENNTLTTQLAEARSHANELQKEKTDLAAQNVLLADAKDKAEAALKLDAAVFDELSSRNVAWRQLINEWATVPDIKAKVLKVDPESNFVLLNVGQKQGVKKNFEFSIFRDGTFVAKVNVFNVEDDMCAAHITVPKLPIQRGDNAWTRLANN